MNAPAIILLVDDVAANRDTLRELLDGQGYQVVEAADGPAALRLAAETPPDLVLLDVMMPGMDGFEMCRRLRADPRLAAVPVILVTSLDDQASRLAGIEAGGDDFITKPFNRVELRARVRTITRLNRYRRLDEQRAQFHWIVEQAADGYLLLNAADEVLFANARARLWLGLPADGGAGAREKFLAAARRTYTPQPPETWHHWPNIPVAAQPTARLLVRPETPLARAFFLEVSIHESTSGRLLRLSDATERLAAWRDQRSFQTMVSHKLRTPLNALHGGLELLAEPGDLSPAETAEFAALARSGAARLVAAVEEVLHFAELSQRPAAGARFELAQLESLVGRVAAGVALPPVQVNLAVETHAVVIGCDPTVLEWVLCELLGNAKKFHPRHAPSVEIVVRLAGAGSVELTVNDNGVTLSPAQLERVGQPYFQGEKNFTGEVPGMGLGLASVTAALWQAGGTCHVRNRTGAPGVCVELTWPRAEAAEREP